MDDVFITMVTINKVRHLENIDIALSNTERKHLILTGKNGSGKTSVLEIMNNLLRNITPIFRRMLPQQDILVTVNNEEGLFQSYDKGEFIFFFSEAHRSIEINLPQGPKKLSDSDNFNNNQRASKVFLQYLVNKRNERAIAFEDGDSETVALVKNWFDWLEEIFRDLFDDKTLRLQYDRQDFTFYFETPQREKFGFNELADGYSAILDIVTELIMRMDQNRTTTTYDMQGIVLIDEIEVHLHVDLQKKILPFLIGLFPRIQFIVSTHSPFVLSSLNNAVIYDLEKRVRVEDLSPYSYSGIVEGYFNIDEYSEQVKQEVQEFEQLLQKQSKTVEEEARLFSLQRRLEKVPVDFAPELVAHFHALTAQRNGQ